MPPVPESSGGPVKGEDPASVIKQVKAGIADASQSSRVVHTYGYFSARESPDGALVHSGPRSGEGYQYIAPDGTLYQRNWSYNEDGSPTGITGHGVTGPVVNGTRVTTLTVINHASRSYSRQRTEHSVTGGASAPRLPALGLDSSPSQVRQALRSGQVTQKGTTTVNGTPAIALSIPASLTGVPDAGSVHRTLYADARTCQPLRTVTVVDGNPGGPYVADWMPAAPDNIAKAKDDSIPAGYTKVGRAG
jgi:hypothetical protein